MKPVKFKDVDVTFAKDQPEYIPLPAQWIDQYTILTCWKLTDEEIEVLKKKKKLWIGIKTFGKPLQPLLPSVNKKDFDDV